MGRLPARLTDVLRQVAVGPMDQEESFVAVLGSGLCSAVDNDRLVDYEYDELAQNVQIIILIANCELLHLSYIGLFPPEISLSKLILKGENWN